MTGDAEADAKRFHRLRSVGRAMADVELAIMDGHNQPLPAGAEGEICVRSARVMKEYVKQGEVTAATIVDGWLHTGDVGFLDEDNYLFITGRVKDLIIRGGENIAPGEIEAILDSHPAIDESAIIGVPDPEWGEAVKAVLVLKPGASITADEVRDYTREHLASYKAPAYVTIIDELPRNPMGKVLKTDLRRDHGGADNN